VRKSPKLSEVRKSDLSVGGKDYAGRLRRVGEFDSKR
jgi:hypothetical protein